MTRYVDGQSTQMWKGTDKSAMHSGLPSAPDADLLIPQWPWASTSVNVSLGKIHKSANTSIPK